MDVDQSMTKNGSLNSGPNDVHDQIMVPTQGKTAQQQPGLSGHEVEAVVDKCLRRLLPDMMAEQLNQALSNVLVRLAADLLQPQQPTPVVRVNGTNQNKPSLKAVLAQVLLETTYLTGLTNEINLFECGLDSVQVPMLMKHLNDALSRRGRRGEPIVMEFLYENPSINQLAQALGDV